MSLINDALKRAREVSTAETSASKPPQLQSLQPVTRNAASETGRFVAVAIIFLIIAGLFFVGFAMTHRAVKKAPVPTEIAPAPVETAVSSSVETTTPSVTATAPPVEPTPMPAPVMMPVAKTAPDVHPEPKPELQGIFYSPTAPAAIVNGKTVRPGEQILQYHVVEITKLTVTLVGADGKTVKLSMDN